MASPSPVDCLGGWILPASGCFCDCVSQSMAFVLVAYYVGVFRSGSGDLLCACALWGVWAGSFHAWSQGGAAMKDSLIQLVQEVGLSHMVWLVLSAASSMCAASDGTLCSWLGFGAHPALVHGFRFLTPPPPLLLMGNSREDDVATGSGSYLPPPSVLRCTLRQFSGGFCWEENLNSPVCHVPLSSCFIWPQEARGKVLGWEQANGDGDP